MSAAKIIPIQYNLITPKKCVCSTWTHTPTSIKNNHHPFCRTLLEGNQVDGLTPEEAFENFGVPGEKINLSMV